MRLAFRCDANSTLGSGHLRRCSVLAEEALRQNDEVLMLLRTDGNPIWKEYIPQNAQCEVRYDEAEDLVEELASWSAERSPDFLVVDQYKLSLANGEKVARIGVPWLMFDGGRTADAIHADIVHNALPGYASHAYASRLIHPKTELLLGPVYALLRPEFRQAPLVNEKPKTVALTFGGGSDRGMIHRVLDSAYAGLRGWHWQIFTTSANAGIAEVRQWIDRHDADGRVKLLVDEPQVAAHLARADFAICAAGTTLYELALLGVPTLCMAIADNQLPSGQRWADIGAVKFLGWADSLTNDELASAIVDLANDESLRKLLSDTGKKLVDGRGAERTLAAIRKITQGVPA